MEKVLFSKMNLYDQFDYLLVGSTFILICYFDSILLNSGINLRLTPEFFVFWLILAYFLGHISHAIANIFIYENKEDFSNQDKEILRLVGDHFRVKKQDYNNLYQLCYMFGLAKDITGHIQLFNSYYSLYRGWLVCFLLESVFLLILLISSWFSFVVLIYLVTSIVLIFLMFNRSKRFYSYCRNKTLTNFLISRRLKL